MTQQLRPERRRLDRTTWITFVAVLAVGLAGIGLVAWRITDAGADGDADVTLPAGHLHGVVTVGGEPRADVAVSVFRVLEDGNEEVAGVRRSTEGGRFVFNGLEPGTYRVTVSNGLPVFARDYLPISVAGVREAFGEAAEVELPADRGVDGVTIDLMPGATLAGEVRTAAGRPAADLPVRAYLLDEQGMSTGVYGEAVTDDQGRYAVTGLPPGKFEVSSSDEYADPLPQQRVGSASPPIPDTAIAQAAAAATQDRRSRTLRAPVALQEGEEAAVPDLTLRRSAVLRGTVRGADGRPRRDVDVVVLVDTVSGWVPGPGAVTDRRGRFEIPGVLPGTYRLGVTGPGGGFLGGARSAEESDPLVVRPSQRVKRGLDLVIRRRPQGD